MPRVLLAVFLTLSLATQVAAVSSQFDSQDFVAGQVHKQGHLSAYNTDFDDDRRGLKSFIVPAGSLPLARAALLEYADSGETLGDFCFAQLPLFKLHAALLI